MGYGKTDPNALAAVGFLNAALRLAGGQPNEELSVDEWTDAMKSIGGNDPVEVANQILERFSGKFGHTGLKVGQAVDGKLPTKAAGSSSQGIAARNKAIYQQAGAEPIAPPAQGPPAHQQHAAPAAAAPKKSSGIAGARAAFVGGEAIAPPEQGPPPGHAGHHAPAAAAPSPAKPASGVAAARKSYEGMEQAGGAPAAASRASWTGPGLFLTYEVAQNGTLNLVYSKTAVPNAIAYGKALKPIPDFKFNTLSGKSELVRGAADAKQFMKGVAAFIKAGKAHGCQVDLNETGGPFEVQAFIHYTNGDRVAKVEPGMLTPTDDLDAVGVIPRANADLGGVKVMAKGIFVQRADSHGGSAS